MLINHLPSLAKRFALCAGLLLVTGLAAGQEVSESLEKQDLQNQKEATAEAERAQEARMKKLERSRLRSRSAEDLSRFTGFYGEPDGHEGKKYLYVAASCNGQLVIGPMWMELSPWWMQSMSETEFKYSDAYTKITLNFVLDDDGQVVELVHDVEGLGSPVQRMEPLPNTWGECLPKSY